MNRRASSSRRSHILRTKCSFDLGDPAEARVHDWIHRFHSSDGIYQLLDLRRVHRQVIMLTRGQAARSRAKPQWLLITFWIDEIRVTLPSYSTLRAARAVFEATTSATPPDLAPPVPHTPA